MRESRALLLFTALSLACGMAGATPTPGPTGTPGVTSTPDPLLTWTPGITVTPTPEPGFTPEPTVTFGPAPDPPVLLAPEDAVRFGPGDPAHRHEWEDVPDAEAYEIELAVDPDFLWTSGLMEVEDPWFDFGDFGIPQEEWDSYSFNAYWRVRSLGAGGSPGDWSDVWSFSKSARNEPEVLGPTLGSRMGPDDGPPTLEWEDLEESWYYTLGFWADPDGTEFLGEMAWSEPELDLDALLTDADWEGAYFTLYWAASSVAYDGVPTRWSDRVRLSRSSLPEAQLLQPADGAWIQPSGPVPYLSWNPVPGAVEYEIGLWALEAAGEPAAILPCSTAGYDLTQDVSQSLWNGVWGTLAWAVSARDAQGNWGAWSGADVFSKLGAGRVMTYGDSITGGWGSAGFPDWGSYGWYLEPQLQAAWGQHVRVTTVFVGGGQAWEGLRDLDQSMRLVCPTRVLTLFGTVDLLDPHGCNPSFYCRTVEHLQWIAEQVRACGVEPYLATLPPPDPDGDAAGMDVEGEVNQGLRQMASTEDIPLCDLYQCFMSYPHGISGLYYDRVHMNDQGYQLMADCWYETLVNGAW